MNMFALGFSIFLVQFLVLLFATHKFVYLIINLIAFLAFRAFFASEACVD